MATSKETMAFVMGQLAAASDPPPVASRKMFGEYAIYLAGKVVALVCDDEVFIKPTPGAKRILEDAEEGHPYPGAKLHLKLGAALDDPDLFSTALRAVVNDLE